MKKQVLFFKMMYNYCSKLVTKRKQVLLRQAFFITGLKQGVEYVQQNVDVCNPNGYPGYLQTTLSSAVLNKIYLQGRLSH